MGKPPPNFSGWPCDKAGYHLQSRTAHFPQSEFVGVLLHDKPSLSLDEAVAVGRAMLQVADHMSNLQSSKVEVKRITVKDIAAPIREGDPNPPLPNIPFDMFDSSIADISIPNFGEPGDRPYLGGFDLSAMDVVLREVLPTVQDMSTLVLDNAQFHGEATDDQDRQWYNQLPVQDSTAFSSTHIAPTARVEFENFSSQNRNITRESYDNPSDHEASSSHIAPIARVEFENFSSHNRNLTRESHDNPSVEGVISLSTEHFSSASASAVTANAVADFAVVSSRSRNLGRMNSEQALDYFLNQHQHRI
jgi:hypothetical protein